MSNLVAYFEQQLADDVPLATALRLTPNRLMPFLCTVGDCFEAARAAGYTGIIPPREPKPGDGRRCPGCESLNTWESHEGPDYIFCRTCLEVYHINHKKEIN